jgi:hypothetical protein
MTENKATTKKIEEYLSRIETLDRKYVELEQREAQARKELELRFNQTVSAQREEIAHLRQELIRERQDRRRRRAKAKRQFESE